MVSISIRELRFGFAADSVVRDVLGGIDLNISSGDIVTIFGPNGCGKTTLLRIIAGLEKDFSGSVLLSSNSNINRKANIGMVPQNPMDSLLPWKRVEENLTFYMANSGIEATVESLRLLLDSLGLYEHRNLFPYQLSGGLKQKLALACATSYRPSILLLDEPFSALDYKSSLEVGRSIRRQWDSAAQTTICVCHQPDHSVLIGNRVIVLSSSPSRVVREILIPAVDRSRPDFFTLPEMQEVRNNILMAFNLSK